MVGEVDCIDTASIAFDGVWDSLLLFPQEGCFDIQ